MIEKRLEYVTEPISMDLLWGSWILVEASASRRVQLRSAKHNE